MKKDFISIKDLSREELDYIFNTASELKKSPKKFSAKLNGKTLGLIFQKPSNRTRVSFEVGVYQLGGYSIYLRHDDIKLGAREATRDIARTLSRYMDAIVARTYSHQDIISLAANASIPVINGLSDLLHPCQGVADVFTIKEKKKSKNIKLSFVGDGNNVLHSLLYCCTKCGINISVCTPEGYGPDSCILKEAKKIAKQTSTCVEATNNIKAATRDADIIYTDVWTSMGHESERAKRLKHFKALQINSKILQNAKKDCLVMHCLPAHRGEEITDDVIDGGHSIVFDQAENRLHVQKALLISLLS